jgi:hypothetical protein
MGFGIPASIDGVRTGDKVVIHGDIGIWGGKAGVVERIAKTDRGFLVLVVKFPDGAVDHFTRDQVVKA